MAKRGNTYWDEKHPEITSAVQLILKTCKENQMSEDTMRMACGRINRLLCEKNVAKRENEKLKEKLAEAEARLKRFKVK